LLVTSCWLLVRPPELSFRRMPESPNSEHLTGDSGFHRNDIRTLTSNQQPATFHELIYIALFVIYIKIILINDNP